MWLQFALALGIEEEGGGGGKRVEGRKEVREREGRRKIEGRKNEVRGKK